MDHILNAIKPYYEAEVSQFLEEWKSGQYKKWSDCPSYDSLRTIIKAANIIRGYLGWSRLTVKELVQYGI